MEPASRRNLLAVNKLPVDRSSVTRPARARPAARGAARC